MINVIQNLPPRTLSRSMPKTKRYIPSVLSTQLGNAYKISVEIPRGRFQSLIRHRYHMRYSKHL